MKTTGNNSNFTSVNLVGYYQTSINRSTKRASLFGALLALVLFAFTAVPAAQATDLLNNFNSGGVSTGLPGGVGTLFTLHQPAMITQLVTYHWNNGQGTPGRVGNIRLWTTSRFLIVNYAAHGVAASFGVIADWEVDIPAGFYLPAGTYILDDTDPATWSHDAQSAGCLPFNTAFQCGFSIVRGTSVSMIPAGAFMGNLTPPPSVKKITTGPTPSALNYFPYKCDQNPAAFAVLIFPCLWTKASTTVVELERPLPAALSDIRFVLQRCSFCSAGVGAFVDAPQAGGPTAVGAMYKLMEVPTLCRVGGNGSIWTVNLFVGIKPYGDIGRFELDCR